MSAETRSKRKARTTRDDGEGYVCIHGHFYQPPRENPWLEEIELQDSAYPYHDWNERITDECYAANATSRILDDTGLIGKITNNYARMSFDFGPTLLAWLERRRPEVLRAVIDADAQSRELFSGHGSAMAQTYNHMIQPLATPRDRRTQVIWGLRDFEHRFGRPAEGMWLPETAVDLDSLEALAESGVRFTVLAPHQAAAVRRIGATEWIEVAADHPLDIGMPYTLRLPSGSSIDVFFYDGPTSRAIAFEGLLRSGRDVAERLLAPLRKPNGGPRLMHVATDGETYGHHHRFGDMALAFALEAVEAHPAVRLTNYAEFLERRPPSHEATIVEDTSWSCAHGVERWRSDCGCRADAMGAWNQAWRTPLRDALDWLRAELEPLYEQRGADYLKDPWAARDAYIDVVLDRSEDNVTAFLSQHAARQLDATDRVAALELLEMQRHAMLMYTSCGWFFDDLAGIETVQVLRYAGRAIDLARRRGTPDLEEGFVQRLERARSNRAGAGTGADIYAREVIKVRADLRHVGAHYAISSLFDGKGGKGGNDGNGAEGDIFCYRVEQADYRRLGTGRARLALGRCRVVSRITEETEAQAFAVLHMGDHNLAAGVRRAPDDETFERAAAALREAFEGGDLPACMNLLEEHFGEPLYALPSLFRDQRRAVLSAIVDTAVTDVEASARRLYQHYGPVLQFLPTPDHPLSRALRVSSEITFNAQLREALDPAELDLDRIERILDESRRWNIDIDRQAIAFEMARAAAVVAEELLACEAGTATMARLEELVQIAREGGFEVNLWRAQNAFYRFMERCYDEHALAAEQGDDDAKAWLRRARALGKALLVRVG